jgi:hypothetical protein
MSESTETKRIGRIQQASSDLESTAAGRGQAEVLQVRGADRASHEGLMPTEKPMKCGGTFG